MSNYNKQVGMDVHKGTIAVAIAESGEDNNDALLDSTGHTLSLIFIIFQFILK